MFNPNINPNSQINDFNTRKKELYVNLTPEEKEELNKSLLILAPKFENFVITFYESFLKKQTLKFIQNSSKETLINMFSACLNLIISSIQQPLPLDDYVDVLISSYPNFGQMIENPDLFIGSFMNALVYTFRTDYNERLGNLWYKAVSDFVKSISVILDH